MDGRISELTTDIMRLAININNKHKNTIFIDFTGHTEELDIRVYKDGWTPKAKRDFSVDIYLSDRPRGDVIFGLQQIIEYLKSLELTLA